MFLSGTQRRWYNRDGSQHASGFFLVLMTPDDDDKATFRGLVRSVKLHQCGHFMMGTLSITIKGKTHEASLSGSYGADGLTRSVPRPIYELGVDLPQELRVKWNNGEGWNDAGTEAPDMNTWAKTLVYPASTYRGRK